MRSTKGPSVVGVMYTHAIPRRFVSAVPKVVIRYAASVSSDVPGQCSCKAVLPGHRMERMGHQTAYLVLTA